MTGRESEVYRIILENPMISQADIASKLGITRSSVSVFINSLVKKGFIKGRGYVVKDDRYGVIIGAAMIDIRGNAVFDENFVHEMTTGNLFKETSNFSITYGGHARNCSELAYRLGVTMKPIFAVSSNIFGNEIISDLKRKNISTECAVILPESTTGIFVEIKSKSGHQRLSFSNNDIEEKMTPEILSRWGSVLNQASWILLDDGLSSESVDYITATFSGTPLYLSISRPNRIDRYIKYIKAFNFLCMSSDSLAVMCERSVTDSCDEEEVVDLLKRLTLTNRECTILIPYGVGKFAFHHKGKIHLASNNGASAVSEKFSHYVGSVIAGVIYCMENQFDIQRTMKFVMACRQVALLSSEFIHPGFSLSAVLDAVDKLEMEYREIIV